MKDTIEQHISSAELNKEAQEYLQVHLPRYQYLLSLLKDLRKKLPEESIRIMDIGPSVFTQLLEKSFIQDTILSMGLEHQQSRGGHLPSEMELDDKRFIRFNLNEAQDPDNWVKVPPCDIIVLAEVLEHLYTAPTLVLNFLNTCLKPGGYLVIQTPNAAALKNRLLMFMGRNPFQMIRENADNPGHFREYTVKELIKIGEKSGFSTEFYKFKNYFFPANRIERIYTAITNLLPDSFKSGITIVLRKEK